MPRLVVVGQVASTSRILQSGQVAETMSRSSEISPAQPVSALGNEVVDPVWLTFVKQPFATVQAGRPYCVRYAARSEAAFGSSYASTIATVCPEAAVLEGSAYAAWMLLGPYPLGVALGVTASAWMDAGSTGSTTLIAMQAS